jgi:preprotein translocase subunit YajC
MGYLAISISMILALTSFLFSCLAFVSIFYYIIDKRRKNQKKESKTNTKNT